MAAAPAGGVVGALSPWMPGGGVWSSLALFTVHLAPPIGFQAGQQ